MFSFITHISVKELLEYREFDRVAKPAPRIPLVQSYSVNEVTEWVRVNGVSQPLELAIFDGKALLVNGNHRVVAADRLNMPAILVEVTYYDSFQELTGVFYNHTIEKFKQIL